MTLSAVDLLIAARQGGPALRAADLCPADAAAAYALQDALLERIGPIGGWKVGAKTPTAEPSCAPMPASGILPTGTSLQLVPSSLRGIEVEIAFRVRRDISGSPQEKFHFQAAMAVLSLMRSVGTPLGFSLDDQPWVSSTIWRTVSDSTNRIYLFDSAMTPATFWVRLDDFDLKPGAPVRKLNLTGGKTYSGNAADKFVEAPLFHFASLDTRFEQPKP